MKVLFIRAAKWVVVGLGLVILITMWPVAVFVDWATKITKRL